ncbi:MAG: dephospho-CoA kinase [Rubripirellula sp.]
MYVLGVVGSPAGGKSTVAKRLAERGATWINADLVARAVLEHDDISQQLIDHFGSDIATSEGAIDRAKLASLVFGDDESKRSSLRFLEGLVHPRTRALIQSQIRAVQQTVPSGSEKSVIILDVPLMFKSGWDRSCDEIWCVDSEREIRLARTKDRGWDDEELQQRESNQLDIGAKRRLSNLVIDNNGTLEQLGETIDRLWGSITQRVLAAAQADDSHCLGED